MVYNATENAAIQKAARARAFSLPLDQLDPGDPDLFGNDTVHHTFERLRKEDPVHWVDSPLYGGYWSVTRYQDIMSVDTNHKVYSSLWKHGGIAIIDQPKGQPRKSFITLDPPEHDAPRLAVSPIVAPGNLAHMEPLIRERTRMVLAGLPRNETFNWADRVSVELTTMMLATLFDFPFEERRLLPWWSDVGTSFPEAGDFSKVPSVEAREQELNRMTEYFARLWNERANQPPKSDLISMLAHNPSTRNLDPDEFRGTIGLLIVGGNDTTRNSMSGGLLALHENPDQFAKLRANPALVESMVPEIIRWQTPLAHMRRTALVDTELAGKKIKAGDKVVMWYLSGNRDESAIENANSFLIDRARPRQHLSFGFGVHRCVGNRLAELQLRVLWEEILQKFPVIEVVGKPVRLRHPFVRGITELPVRIPG
jgi:cytochrome P450